MNINSPIGIFDSGVGGLTVAKVLFQLLPNENIIYFGDVGRTPYGGRSDKIIKEFTQQDIAFLIEKDVKLIISACNSASSVALPEIRSQYKVEIIGVIKPGSQMAVERTKNGKIGVIGTKATVNSRAYENCIHSFDDKINITAHACPLFVPLVEEDYQTNKATRLIAEDYLQPLKDTGVDTLVLGCTHYPLLKDLIQEIMGDNVTLIDSGEETARAAQHYLYSITSVKDAVSKISGRREFYVSDVPDKFSLIASRFLGQKVVNVEQVDISCY